MVRETRHLWVGNLPENIREERIREHFKRYGRVQSVKLLPRCTEEKTGGEITMACTVAFMDIKSASKAHNSELKIDDRTLNTEYYEPAAIPSSASPQTNAPSPYSTSPGSTRFPNGHGSTDDHGTSAFSDRCFYDRSSSSRLTGGSGSVSSGGGSGSGDAASEFGGAGRNGGNRASANAVPSAATPASGSYHGDVVTTTGGRTSSSSTPTAAASGAGGVTVTGTGRSRERTGSSYRNGPYGSASASAAAASLESSRHSSRPTVNNSWGYDSSRYNSTGNKETDTGYSNTPSENNERRTLEQSSKKKTKSRSGSRSPSPSGSASSRSPSRSRSRSSSSSSSSSISRDTSSTSSPKSKRIASSNASNSNHQPVVHSDDRRPLAICVKNLPVRSSDTSLKDGLFHEYKKHGKVTWVKVVGKDAERHAIVCFKKPEDVEKALEVSYDKLFFGCKIEVAPYQGYDVEDNDLRPYEAEIDEYHPKATRTLFIGNLEKDVTASDLRKHFDQFGEIIEIDIKKQGAVSSYAFCQYSDIVSVVKAIRKMDGEHLGNNRIKLGFGKSMPYNCVWIDGVNENVNEKYLKMQFEPFGVISKIHIDRDKGQALVFYDQVMSAQTAVTKMRGFTLKNTKIQVDFASRECQESFFERLEKQGTILDRSIFEERRETSARVFDPATTRFSSRYDTPTRPRTSSYSSRSNASASQVTSSLQSPGTPGSVTPRGTSSRSRRFADYYDQTLEYADRHFRSYDEYSQSSTASHEDLYDHEYGFIHDNADPIQTIDNVVSFAPPDMRNLQKERVHLLEQLEECPSSGDELISPKKRIKLDLLDSVITSDVIIEANRDHRKVMEVRRLSDVNLKHHSRRPSIDSGKHVRHDVVYVPHSVCKRRKTAGSDSGSRVHHYDHSGSESVGGSRPGTPLCDERPENFPPTEPRRVPREREGPLTLPLPRFAAQIMNRGSVSVAGIKGQKDNILSSPPPAVTSPRISNPRPPSPVHVPPPASPPPRPPSLSSNSSDSDITPPSPSLEERIKSLDEKYEKWSGSRALSAAGGDALALIDANLEKFRQRHKILDLDLKEVQPSEIVKSVMAKRSVFDEDLKRLENVGEKYEPKDFSFFPRTPLITQTSVPASPLLAPPALKLNTATALPKTPTLLSPRSSGTGIQAAKGLQYPFPTHPPNLMSPVVSSLPQTSSATTTISVAPPTAAATSTTTVTTAVTTTTTATTTSSSMPSPARGASHGENRLKPCPSAPSDTRTISKITVNKSNVVSSVPPVKTSEKTSVNIPGEVKTKGDKTGEKISCRRDSNSNSPRADVKTRRNSDASARKSDDSDAEAHKERAQIERMEKIKAENKKLEKEKSEKERIERERHEHEKQEKIRLEKERIEKERLERESELEKQRLEKERLEKERLEKEQQEKERAEKEKLRLEREEKAQREKERLEKERQEQERLERLRLERERKEKEDTERRLQEEKLERERQEQERIEKEKRDKDEADRKFKEEKERREEEERIEREKRERERVRHKEDNQEKRKDEHNKHRETHSDNKHRENHLDKHIEHKEKEEKIVNQISTNQHSFEKKIHLDRESERRKESIKENRDNNIHEKHKHLVDNRIRELVETRHMSIDLDKTKLHDKDPSKRKERNNSLPASIGSKRRFSSHETIEAEETKKVKLSHERRDSKDSTRSEERIKSKHKNNINKSHEKHSSKDSEEKRKEREERHKKHKLEKQKSKSKSREKEAHETTTNIPLTDKEFLNRLELKSTEESEKFKKDKESKEKRITQEEHEKIKKLEKIHSLEKSSRSKSDAEGSKSSEEKKKRDRIRKLTNSSDSDSDEPKKHSIFDIVDDEPAYISMYDKVKARSCKNMAKLEEEKRQEKLKAKFTQLKQSRAKREEKKRSTSWDEDSDSDKEHSEIKMKRCPKMLIDSSDDESQERKPMKKKEIYSDSDSSAIFKHLKQDIMDTSDDESRNKSLILKTLKSRITSDTSEDENNKKKLQHIKAELFTDSTSTEIQSSYNIPEDKPQLFDDKEDLSKLIKTERRNSKYQESPTEMNSSLFSDVSQSDVKSEKFNNKNSFVDITTDEEAHEAARKERTERREKKHKKKQRKQKHSLSSEDTSKLDIISDSLQSETIEKPKHEKKKDHSKKEKRRDKNREGREKSKKSKKNKLEGKCDSKREGKMENIFGSLSEDSENGNKETQQQPKIKTLTEEEINTQQQNYNSESEKEPEIKIKEKSERERDKEEHKRKKEKKRREKERRLQEAAAAAATLAAAAAASSLATAGQESNENSMDYIDMGKQLEANMMLDESLDASESVSKSADALDATEDAFTFNEVIGIKKDKEERREGKEKKKKRKKSKDEKNKHHNHHHHDKNKVKHAEIKTETSPSPVLTSSPVIEKLTIKEEVVTPPPPPSASLPNILEEQPSEKPLTPDLPVIPLNTIIIKSAPQEIIRDKLIPGFGTQIDEKIHESAVKSISEFEPIVKKEEIVVKEEEEKPTPVPDEKPRVVISQEETEDAVAALLGESFGSVKQEEFYTENTILEEPSNTLVEENNVQDDEEMRQAVQSLSAADLDVKPDTPQSEHDLQIDTDTEEQEDVPLRFDTAPKTPEMSDFPPLPKTPDLPPIFANHMDDKSVTPIPVLKTTPNIGSPPSLTPIRPQTAVEAKKTLNVEKRDLPVLPEQQQRTVISKSWPVDSKLDVPTSKPAPSVIKIEQKAVIAVSSPSVQNTPVTGATSRNYTSPPVLKIAESPFPPLKPLSKQDHLSLSPLGEVANKLQAVPVVQTLTKSPTPPQLHNLPARSPMQINKAPTSLVESGLSPRLPPGLIHNRMPITSVMVSKAMQPTTVILQQSKLAHTLEPPKLVSTSEVRSQERARMVYQSSTLQSPQFGNFGPNPPRMVIPGNIRHLQPQGLLVPTRQINPHNFNYMSNPPHPTFNIPTSSHNQDNSTARETNQPLPPVVPASIAQPAVVPSHPPLQPITIPKDTFTIPTPTLPSPKSSTNCPSPNPFSPSALSPRLKNSPSPKPTPPAAPSPKPTSSSPSPVTSSITAVTMPPEVSCPSFVIQPTPKLVELPRVPTPKVAEPLVTSTPSPVIVSTASAVDSFKTTSVLSTPEIKHEPAELNKEEKPVKLAIEAVTEELNMTLEKSSPKIKEEIVSSATEKSPELLVKLEHKEEPKIENLEEKILVDSDKDICNKVEKMDEEKTETESIVSDISKERSASADILAKDDPLDSKEDSDYWSAKEVNIDSVIKTLCSADEMSDHSSENGKSEWFDDPKPEKEETNETDNIPTESKEAVPQSPEKKEEPSPVAEETKGGDTSDILDESTETEPEVTEQPREAPMLRSSSRRGGRGRGRTIKPQKVERPSSTLERAGGIQTRRGKLKELSQSTPVSTKRGRGGKPRSERKPSKTESDSSPADVYEFRDEPDDSNKEQRPRLILTIKSPAILNSNNAQTTAIVKEVTKDGAKEIGKEQPKEISPPPIKPLENKEEFLSPSTNTRKSRRLQERDTSKTTVDDTIEDVVKNTVQTRATSNQRRSGRQATPKQGPSQPDTPRKSPRGRRGRRGSEAAENSSSEETSKEEIKLVLSPPLKPTEKTREPEKSKEPELTVEMEKLVEKPKPIETPKEKQIEGLKATVLRRIKSAFNPTNPNEPTSLIDPVTGELIPMRESEEGKYIPLPGTSNMPQPLNKKPEAALVKQQVESPKPVAEVPKTQASVIAQPQQLKIVQQKPHSLKAHVLASQAAQAVVHQAPPPIVQPKPAVEITSTTPSVVVTSKPVPQEIVVTRSVVNAVSTPPALAPVKPVIITKSITPIVATKAVVPSPVVTKTVTPINQHLTVNTNLNVGVSSAAHISPRPAVPLNVTSKPPLKALVKPPVLSPVLMQQKQQIQQMLQVNKQAQVSKAHLPSTMVSQTQMVMAHMKHQPLIKQQVMMSKGPIGNKSLHQHQIISGAIPSPPLIKSQSPLNNAGRIIQGPGGPKGMMDPPKIEVSMGNVILGQRSKLSPQGPQQRIVGQTGLPLPGYEPNLHGERSLLTRSRSPPPAHQNSPSPKGEAIAHFPPGPLRPPPDLNPAHYMHPQHVMQYQQYLRQHQQQLQHLSRSGVMEKDGQEGEEAPVTSPPLELRRPGSVGHVITGRGTSVPHSLHSPHDRTTDSPQVGQVYNVHSSARIPYAHPNRYYDQAEPPPAHRPLTSHGSLAALGSDRGLAHMAPIGTPDRPLSSHSALQAHMGGLGPDRGMTHIERPLSGHGMMGAGLGAAGNLMGAVARHIGADAPASQRGLQAATPPHASQVPPQAESLLMLLKQYPCMWQGLLALKNDQAAVQMYFVSGNDDVAKCSLPKNTDGSTPPLRIFQRMRLEPPQVEGVARKMQMENEHCMLLALPCGHDHMDVLKQSTNLTSGFITYLQLKQAAGIVNVAAPGTTQPPAYVVHIFPSCDFVNENLRRIAPSLLERVADIAHLLIVITTV
ncbi:protein split ends isoform X1 [Diabrotica virgifera virgifera]|uniref:Protein split ends n=1 Tax=Diabrotica virgifera virgifera TaxID=50390 RepID=A0ABM5JYP3_DIAVI|nr:protein split ends isoform X1 [Diabrotica virgifera virgifera]